MNYELLHYRQIRRKDGDAAMEKSTSEHPKDGVYARPNQPLAEHLTNVSVLASRFGGKCGLAEHSKIAGALHDYGKATPMFQDYLRYGGDSERGRVPHSIYGAKRVYGATAAIPVIADILSNIIASHHGSLRDNISPDGGTPLRDSLSDTEELSVACSDADMSALKSEFSTIFSALPKNGKAFSASMLAKYLYSCLIDADRLDAYLFDSGERYLPETPDWNALLTALECSLAGFETRSEMARLRQGVSKDCAKAGLREIGIYKLEVPTGGGKTLSGLRFALEHARTHNLDRIIYIIPYLSILSQTANEIRRALNADENTVLEHHSDFLPDCPENYKLNTDRWDAPIILSTQIQFLESIFSAKGSDLRKLHNMSRSVIIFDEVQSLPVKCIHLFNGAVNFLHRVCGSTVLLCTATQPLLDAVKHPIELSPNPSIADCGAAPIRYRIINKMIPAGYSYPELAEFAMTKHSGSTLIIVNTKIAAKLLHEELIKSGTPVLHLSTNMCSAHRNAVIDELRRRLSEKEPVICVSTQLIEAGVDISFECVIRDVAGLDSIYQAAGRCNRHGEFGEVKNVYVVNIKNQNLDRLPDIKIGAEITRRLFDDGNPDMNEYYRCYFHERRGIMDYPIRDGGTVYDLLNNNDLGFSAHNTRKDKQKAVPPALRSAFRSAAEEFFVIDRGRTDVVVPYKEGKDLLLKYYAADDTLLKRDLLRKLGKYSVSLYGYQRDGLSARGALSNPEGLMVLADGFYHEERGVDLEGSHEFLHT